jgi:hypothetical protein
MVPLVRLLQLDGEVDPAAGRPAAERVERRHVLAGKGGSEPPPRVECADLGTGEVGDPAVAVGRPIDGVIVDDDELARYYARGASQDRKDSKP